MRSIIDGCARVAREARIAVPDPRLHFEPVAPGMECVRNDGRGTVIVQLSTLEQLHPPPVGSNLVYAIAHEVGHLAVSLIVDSNAHLPVVWDEALADAMARGHFLPGLWRDAGPSLWPQGWEPEAQLPVPSSEPFSYGALLVRQRHTIDAWVAQHGWAPVLAAVARVAAGRVGAEGFARATDVALSGPRRGAVDHQARNRGA